MNATATTANRSTGKDQVHVQREGTPSVPGGTMASAFSSIPEEVKDAAMQEAAQRTQETAQRTKSFVKEVLSEVLDETSNNEHTPADSAPSVPKLKAVEEFSKEKVDEKQLAEDARIAGERRKGATITARSLVDAEKMISELEPKEEDLSPASLGRLQRARDVLMEIEGLQDSDEKFWNIVQFRANIERMRDHVKVVETVEARDEEEEKAILEQAASFFHAAEKENRIEYVMSHPLLAPFPEDKKKRREMWEEKQRRLVTVRLPGEKRNVHFVSVQDTPGNRALIAELRNLAQAMRDRHKSQMAEIRSELENTESDPHERATNGQAGFFVVQVGERQISGRNSQKRILPKGIGSFEIIDEQGRSSVHPQKGVGRFACFNEMYRQGISFPFAWLRTGQINFSTESPKFPLFLASVNGIREGLGREERRSEEATDASEE